MSNQKYHITSGLYSAERQGLKKIDELIQVLQALVTKLDQDTGLSDTDYNELLETLRTMRSDTANWY
jgi:hypothetical protein